MQQRLGQRTCLTAVLVLLSSSSAGAAGIQEGAALGPLEFERIGVLAHVQDPAPQGAEPTSELMTVPLPSESPSGATPITETPTLATPEPVEAATAPVPVAAQDAAPIDSRWSAVKLPEAGGTTSDGELLPSGEGAGEALQVGASLAGVLALIWVLRYLLRRARGDYAGSRILASAGSPSGVASILAKYPVSRGHQVVLLEVGRRVIVAHQGDGSMSTLSEITDAEEVADLKARLSGVERTERDKTFNAKLSSSLEATPEPDSLASVAGMPGMVAETVDLTRRRKRSQRLVGGGV